MNEILNLEDVSKMLKVSKRTVQREVEAGRLEAFRVGRALRFRSEAVDEYMKKQVIKPGDSLDEDEELPDVA